MSYSPSTKRDCISSLEACYNRKLTSKERRKTYKELYAWYKSVQRAVNSIDSMVNSESKDLFSGIKDEGELIEQLERQVDEANETCLKLGMGENSLKFVREMKLEIAKLKTSKNDKELIKQLEDMILEAHIAGQHNQGVDASHYEALVYCNNVIKSVWHILSDRNK